MPARCSGRFSPAVSERSLENEHLLAEFTGDGEIVRLYDKDNDREVLPEGARRNPPLDMVHERPERGAGVAEISTLLNDATG